MISSTLYGSFSLLASWVIISAGTCVGGIPVDRYATILSSTIFVYSLNIVYQSNIFSDSLISSIVYKLLVLKFSVISTPVSSSSYERTDSKFVLTSNVG